MKHKLFSKNKKFILIKKEKGKNIIKKELENEATLEIH